MAHQILSSYIAFLSFYFMILTYSRYDTPKPDEWHQIPEKPVFPTFYVINIVASRITSSAHHPSNITTTLHRVTLTYANGKHNRDWRLHYIFRKSSRPNSGNPADPVRASLLIEERIEMRWWGAIGTACACCCWRPNADCV